MERTHELIALAALGELTTAEQLELDQAIQDDPAVGAELDDALTAAATLQRLGSVEPPASIRPAVLSAIASTPQDDLSTSQPDPTNAAASPAESAAAVDDLAARRARRRFRPMLLAAAAVALFATADRTDFVLGVTQELADGSQAPSLPILAAV